MGRSTVASVTPPSPRLSTHRARLPPVTVTVTVIPRRPEAGLLHPTSPSCDRRQTKGEGNNDDDSLSLDK